MDERGNNYYGGCAAKCENTTAVGISLAWAMGCLALTVGPEGAHSIVGTGLGDELDGRHSCCLVVL